MLVMAACRFKGNHSEQRTRAVKQLPIVYIVRRCCHDEDTVLFSMFKEVKLICKFMDVFHTTHSFQRALFNRVDRFRFLHHDIDFSVTYGGRSDN